MYLESRKGLQHVAAHEDRIQRSAVVNLISRKITNSIDTERCEVETASKMLKSAKQASSQYKECLQKKESSSLKYLPGEDVPLLECVLVVFDQSV